MPFGDRRVEKSKFSAENYVCISKEANLYIHTQNENKAQNYCNSRSNFHW